jgi:GxxExxY protein
MRGHGRATRRCQSWRLYRSHGLLVSTRDSGVRRFCGFDLLVHDCLLVKAKAVEEILPMHKPQWIRCMKLLHVPLGLLMNFNEGEVTGGLSRPMLPGPHA